MTEIDAGNKVKASRVIIVFDEIELSVFVVEGEVINAISFSSDWVRVESDLDFDALLDEFSPFCHKCLMDLL